MKRRNFPLLVGLVALASVRADCNARRAGSSAPLPPQLPGAKPVIGVLTVPLSSESAVCETVAARAGLGARGASCFSTFYFRWLEAAGARALILPFDADAATFSALLDGVNGVLLTGGELNASGLDFSSPYMTAAKQVLDTAKAKTDAGVFFPVHGTCQGMQVISLLESQNASVMSYGAFDSEGLSLPLEITWDGHHSTRLFSANTAPADIVQTFMSENVTLNLHHDGVTPDAFEASSRLSTNYVLASINADRKGSYFVSTMEACNYPVTATQWHPERPAQEWKDGLDINHGETSIAANNYVATFFVGDARRNNQSFSDPNLFAKYSVFSYPVHVRITGRAHPSPTSNPLVITHPLTTTGSARRTRPGRATSGSCLVELGVVEKPSGRN